MSGSTKDVCDKEADVLVVKSDECDRWRLEDDILSPPFVYDGGEREGVDPETCGLCAPE